MIMDVNVLGFVFWISFNIDAVEFHRAIFADDNFVLEIHVLIEDAGDSLFNETIVVLVMIQTLDAPHAIPRKVKRPPFIAVTASVYNDA